MPMRTLSSRATIYRKFVVSGFLIVCGILFLDMFIGSTRDDPAATGPVFWLFLLFWLGITVWYVMRVAAWKRVRMDLDSLYVSNYSSEIRVPLTQVEEVWQRRGWPRTVTIRLRGPGVFGPLISFHPRLSFAFWRQHPVVAELRQLAGSGVLTPQQLERAIKGDRRRLWTFIGLFIVFLSGMVFFVEAMIRHSEPFQMGLRAVTQDAVVIKTLGAPLQPGYFVGGHLEEGGGGGCAGLDVSLGGSRAQGRVYIEAIRVDSIWHLSHVWVEVPQVQQGRIEVVPAAPSAADSRCAGRDGEG